MCKLVKWVRNCVVFWKNSHSWQKFYTTAGRDGRDKFQVCLYLLSLWIYWHLKFTQGPTFFQCKFLEGVEWPISQADYNGLKQQWLAISQIWLLWNGLLCMVLFCLKWILSDLIFGSSIGQYFYNDVNCNELTYSANLFCSFWSLYSSAKVWNRKNTAGQLAM